MAITFDTTVSGTDSNSYVTVAEFNTYVEKQVHNDEMPKASQTTLIKKLLIAATEAVDMEVSSSAGSVTVSTQRLEYPRVGLTDRRGNAIDDTTIPQELKDAVSEMAIYLYQNELNHNKQDNWEDDLSATDIGGSVKFTYENKDKPTSLIPAQVKALLDYMGTAYVAPFGRVRRS